MPYNFKERRDIEAVLDLIRQPSRESRRRRRPKEPRKLTTGWLFKTPVAGIAAASGTTAGSALCTPYYLDADLDFTELLDNEGASQTVTVANIFGGAIAGDVYITAKEVYGVLVADAEDCG